MNAQFLPAICRMNYGDARECSWLQPAAKEGKNALDAATRYKTILSIPGVQVSKQQFYEDNDLVQPEEGDDVLIGQASGGQQQGNEDTKGQDQDADESPSAAVGKAAVHGPQSTVHLAAARDRLLTSSPTANAKDAATEKLVENVLEDLTAVEAKWLGGVKPYFRRLCALAQSSQVSDKEFVTALEKAQREMPELFDKLDSGAVATALEGAMGAAAVNGVVAGQLKRKH